jgi:hypothetical protein
MHQMIDSRGLANSWAAAIFRQAQGVFDWLNSLRYRLFPSTAPKSPTLLDYAENYLVVFGAGDNDEKNRHARKLFDVANEVSAEVGVRDFLELINTSDEDTLTRAAIYARTRFEAANVPAQDGYWLAAYALAHLMVLYRGKVLEDNPRAKYIADCAVDLYSAEHARRKHVVPLPAESRSTG